MRQLAACIPEIAAGPPEIYFHFLHLLLPPLHTHNIEKTTKTRSNWLNYALRGDEAVHWMSIGQQLIKNQILDDKLLMLDISLCVALISYCSDWRSPHCLFCPPLAPLLLH